MEPRPSSGSSSEVFEEPEEWNPAPEDDFFRDSLELVDDDEALDLLDGADANWA